MSMVFCDGFFEYLAEETRALKVKFSKLIGMVDGLFWVMQAQSDHDFFVRIV